MGERLQRTRHWRYRTLCEGRSSLRNARWSGVCGSEPVFGEQHGTPSFSITPYDRRLLADATCARQYRLPVDLDKSVLLEAQTPDSVIIQSTHEVFDDQSRAVAESSQLWKEVTVDTPQRLARFVSMESFRHDASGVLTVWYFCRRTVLAQNSPTNC